MTGTSEVEARPTPARSQEHESAVESAGRVTQQAKDFSDKTIHGARAVRDQVWTIAEEARDEPSSTCSTAPMSAGLMWV
jgi:hypothetical protein